MGRKIRLTESEFHSLIRRIVVETQEDMDDYSDELPSFDSEGMFKGMSKPNGDMEEFEDNDDTNSHKKNHDVKVLADFFSEKLNDLSDRDYEKLVQKVEDLDMDAEDVLRESDEKYSDLERRKDMRKGRALQTGAVAAGVPAIMGFLAQLPGWVDFSTMTKAHELFEMLHLGNYTGPVLGAVIVAAIIAAIKGQIYKDEARSGKRY